MSITFQLNGASITVDDVDPHTTLLAWLRSTGRTGTKEGCAEGECGACAVALLRRDVEGRTRYEPVNSCLFPLAAAAGHEIITVEGIAEPNGTLHPVQAAMVKQAGSQCGYCTPGFVVSLFSEYYRPGRDGYDPESISGNLCRCTGYRPIADVARQLPVSVEADARTARLADPAPQPRAVSLEHEAGAFHRPTSLADVLALLSQYPDATLMNGATDLMVYANQRYERWKRVIALDAVPELMAFEVTDAEVTIGAGLHLAAVEDELHRRRGLVPVLEQLLPLYSSRLIRNRATFGGSLGTASPIGDAAPALLALDAEVTIVRQGGERRVPLAKLFVDYRTTSLQPGEVLQLVHLPRPLPARQRFYKVSKRILDDISTVAAGCALDLDAEGRVTRLRLAYGGVAATPVRARAAEAVAVGKPWNDETLRAVEGKLATVGTPMSDLRGSADYRRAMVVQLARKFFEATTQVQQEAAE